MAAADENRIGRLRRMAETGLALTAIGLPVNDFGS
jgi:hypothetical protein